MRAQGLYAGSVDGVKGPITKGAIVAFQRRQGLVPDGRIGAQTRRALGELGNPLLGQRALEVGAVGWDVSALEFKLVPFGLPPASVDGRFTPATGSASMRSQSRGEAPVDGRRWQSEGNELELERRDIPSDRADLERTLTEQRVPQLPERAPRLRTDAAVGDETLASLKGHDRTLSDRSLDPSTDPA